MFVWSVVSTHTLNFSRKPKQIASNKFLTRYKEISNITAYISVGFSWMLCTDEVGNGVIRRFNQGGPLIESHPG